ncbi:hypothetical protein SEA_REDWATTLEHOG_36 [Gordonia phage RedWattleHog]|uniref:Uncharacterized protein n=1 Tax=Gordonia phage Stormageddon TaxID=2656541 RepID=A0A649VR03_9CAUD|nr:hypothetical protein KHQ86_gp033 [Gordonia phage Stormageddon]QGJ94896.1 hypothetical protein SEA_STORMAGEDDON_33 [Gordonia phage Stormageddon]QLF83540.1 hypothetical protein SEA_REDWATTLEHOG_36 [Gordonia phage RedWattleHog]
MKTPLPIRLTQRISERAVINARAGIARRGWSRGAQLSIEPAPKPGSAGLRTTRKYLLYQEYGTRPFLMTSLEGKTVPIRGQFFRVKGVGMPGMGYQDRKYEAHKGPIWRDQRWRHPGIRPEGFMQNALRQAMLESGPLIQREMMDTLKGDKHGRS